MKWNLDIYLIIYTSKKHPVVKEVVPDSLCLTKHKPYQFISLKRVRFFLRKKRVLWIFGAFSTIPFNAYVVILDHCRNCVPFTHYFFLSVSLIEGHFASSCLRWNWTSRLKVIRGFHKYTILAIMPVLASEALLCEIKKNLVPKCYP